MIMSNFLDDYLIVNIVSRLPVESVLRCRCVCKRWRALLHELYFIQIHTDRRILVQQHTDDQCPLSLFMLEVDDRNLNNYECYLRDYYYVKYDDERVWSSSSSSHKDVISSLLNPSPFTILWRIQWSVIGSSNGLIGLHGFDTVYTSCGRPALIIIYNPITREYLNLPAAAGDGDDLKDGRFNFMAAIGFGYHPSTKEYKIVRIIHQSDIIRMKDNVDDSYDRWLHIYTLGSSRGKWRIRKVGVPAVTYQGSDFGVLAKGAPVNGAIYWLTRSDTIVSFDLEDEKFRIIDSPPSPRCGNILGGERLCVVEGKTEDIWVMNNNGDQYSWSKEFSIPVKGLSSKLIALGRDRVVCLCLRKYSLISFDRRNITFKSLDDFGVGGKYLFGIISYTKSLVSLKALGEEDAKVLETQQPAAADLFLETQHPAAADMKTKMIKLLGFAMVTIQLLQL